MPSHKIHMAIAKKVNNVLKLDLDSVMLGSIMPDVCIGRNHTVSHYQNGKLGVDGTANPDLFIKKHKKDLNNPVMMGYLIHILTDKFYNTYAFTKWFIYDKDGNDAGLHFKHKDKLLPPEKVKYYKQREFGLYDKWLLNHGYVPKFSDYKCVDNVVDLEVAKYDKNSLKDYIKEANNDIDKINIFSKLRLYNFKLTSKKELDRQFYLCIDYILEYIKNIK